jgi:hypothetical protein
MMDFAEFRHQSNLLGKKVYADAPVVVQDIDTGKNYTIKKIEVEDFDRETSTGGQTIWIKVEES